MNKYLFSLFLAIVLPSVSAEELSEQGIRNAIIELDSILRSERSSREKNEASANFFKKIENLGENVPLAPLIKERYYFNTAFGQIPEEVESRLSDRLFQVALNRENFFVSNNGPNGPETVLAHDYLRKRFDLKLQEEKRSALYGAFVDPEFLGELSQKFEAIIVAGSEGEKLEAEGKAAKFLEDYKYRPWLEVLEERQEKQNRQKKRNTPEGGEEPSATKSRAKKSDHLSKIKVTNENGDHRDPSGFSWFSWGEFGVVFIIIVVLYICIIRKIRKC